MRALLLLLFCFCACKPGSPPTAAVPWSEEWLLREGTRYLEDAEHRRQTVLESLENPTNNYSVERVSSYGLQSRGWDLLPVWNPRSAPVVEGGEQALAEVWNGARPSTLSEWVALGREAFFRFPLRADAYVEWAIGKPDIAKAMGLTRLADGSFPGVVRFDDVDGARRVGITCALCHSAPRAGRLHVGEARRQLDYGALRLAFHEQTGRPLNPASAERMARWGPGRADVTEDSDEDPVAIPDLWGLKSQSALTQAGTIRHVGPAALAIRQETQFLHANHQRVRPPRELAWALAMYLYSLEPEQTRHRESLDEVAKGRVLFERQCRKCHSNAAGGGDPISAAKVGTDDSLSRGAGRGTGKYRPPALIRVRDAAPYLHDGTVASLEELFSSTRFSATYAGSPRRTGPVEGHRYGTSLSTEDCATLLAYLRSL